MSDIPTSSMADVSLADSTTQDDHEMPWAQPHSSQLASTSSSADVADLQPEGELDQSTISSRSPVSFVCSVSDPQKEQDGSQNAFISYKVVTETNCPSFERSPAQVRRRFSDFSFLYELLSNEYAACAIPPLPDKSRLEYVKGDHRFGSDFTSKRAASLTRFLDRVTMHPVLKRSRILYAFLESNDWNSTYRKQMKNGSSISGTGPSTAGGMLDGISDTFLNAFSRVHEESKEVHEIKERCSKLDDNLGAIEKSFVRIVRKESELSRDLAEFGDHMSKLADIEPHVGAEFHEFARAIQFLSSGLKSLTDNLDTDFVGYLRDSEHWVSVVRSLVKQREQKQLDYEALVYYLGRAKSDRESMLSGSGGSSATSFLRSKVEDLRGINNEQARQGKIMRLEKKIADLEKEVTSAEQTSHSFEKYTLNEMAIFDAMKTDEMNSTMARLADYHVDFFKSLVSEYEGVLNNMKQ